MTQARITLADIDTELAALGSGGTDGTVTETADEQAERQQIAAARQTIASQTELQAQRLGAPFGRLDETLAALASAVRWAAV
jgi:DNA repair protein SbcC/Rad50